MATNKPDDLHARHAPIDMTPQEFRAAGHKLIDDIAAFLESVRRRPVNYNETPTELRALLPQGPVPETGTDPAALLEEVAPLLFDHSLFSGHPKYYGYIVSSPSPIGALGDLLAATINPNAGGYQLAPIAGEIELQCIRWIAELIGFPTDCGGVFVSGGNMANFVCFLAARTAKAGPDIRTAGIAAGKGRMLIYTTEETHTWIQKATDLFGHGTGAIRRVAVDTELRADVESLRRMIAEDRERGDHPLMIVGSAGTVSTGAVDPLTELAAVAREEDLWLHVDGAYGALAAVLPDAPAELQALGQADSIAVDPHKWLYSPVEAGVALVRDPQVLPNAFSYRPPYYRFEEEDEPRVNFYERSMQNSRHFRALKVWLNIRQVGRSGYVQMIGDDIRLAGALYRVADLHPELEAMTHNLSITTFRFVPRGLSVGDEAVEAYLNQLNEALLACLKNSGEVFFSNAVLDGTFVLRACIVNFRTSLDDIEALPEIVTRYGREIDDKTRPEHLR